ncbi:MAG: Na+:solute symporter [Pirellulales bacterium]|nr:Na+:solute symporter [Pirellulales bacterium]
MSDATNSERVIHGLTEVDYVVLLCYLLGILVIGIAFSARNKTATDMFTAGGQSPWWASGLSAFMTMFSANTFVVWGGIAYRLGLVAVAINLMYGVAALLVGYFVAGKWKALGVKTPAEFIQLRYGTAVLHFYTWTMTVFRMVTTAGALYALGRILVTLMPLADGNPLQDPATGNLSLYWGIIIFSSIVVLYTMIGGLWAVLMTDVLQFIVLNLAVLFVIPLVITRAGGVAAALDAAGKTVVDDAGNTMLSPIAGDYTFLFLAGWCAVHFFMIGAEWAFVQRFLCVPDAKAAKKSTYLFGLLYLVSPLLWLLPPLIWRVVEPIPAGASGEVILRLQETAYIDACRAVLPSGMVGLMIAAMFSATASMVSSQLNVFCGVLTHDIYRPLAGAKTDDRSLVWVGRGLTIVLGAVLMAIAVAYQSLGGAEKVIVAVTELIVVALLAPTIWALFSRSITAAAVWTTASLSLASGAIARWGLGSGGFLNARLPEISAWVQDNSTTVKTCTGVVLPVVLLLIFQLLSRGTAAGYQRVAALADREAKQERQRQVVASRAPAYTVAVALVVCGLMMGLLLLLGDSQRPLIGLFAVALLGIAGTIVAFASGTQRKNRGDSDHAQK